MLHRNIRGRVLECERHAHDLARLGESHPLHPIAVACIQDSPEDRLSAVVLCERLGELKLSPLYKLFPSIGKSESINTVVTSTAGVFSNVDQAGASHQLEAVTQAMQLVPPGADVQLMREERERAQVEAERLIHEKDELRAELDDIQQQRENLEEELGQSRHREEELREELEQTRQERDEASQEAEEHIITLMKERQRARQARKDAEALRAQCEDLEKDQNQLDMMVSLARG